MTWQCPECGCYEGNPYYCGCDNYDCECNVDYEEWLDWQDDDEEDEPPW